MTAKEKQRRAAEVAGVAQFFINASIPKHTGGRGPRTVKIKDAQDTAIMAATLLQKMWRGVVAKRGVAAVRVAVEKRPSFEPCQSASVAARTARGPTASKPAQQPIRGESRILPLGSAKVTNDGARDHSMDHTDGTHHASALEPQPRAAVHLHPA